MMASVSREGTCLSEGIELQNGGLRIRLGELQPDSKSVKATILSPESLFANMESESMIFHRDQYSHDKWVSERTYHNDRGDRLDQVVIGSNFGKPLMRYVQVFSKSAAE